jgi:hypothetical protein
MVAVTIILGLFSDGGGVEKKKQPTVEANLKEPSGIGGWLIVVVISFVFATYSNLTYLINDVLSVFEPQVWREINQPRRGFISSTLWTSCNF